MTSSNAQNRYGQNRQMPEKPNKNKSAANDVTPQTNGSAGDQAYGGDREHFDATGNQSGKQPDPLAKQNNDPSRDNNKHGKSNNPQNPQSGVDFA